ncbi:MAG: hypothetical protein SPD98_07505 [Tractidigestivibacter sp.]|uniref:hypothetical protein n=1 Tax=Tractidigestivibacter sp. TaxID=2847320 RepID=UPI002A8310EE|nr:hypothetical protein [Tractidigestivibacter sp.]MDY4535077.1 hypothetical protein [Tractidigestivibacter sp.]
MDLLTIRDKSAFFCIPGGTEKNVMDVIPEDIESALEFLINDESIEIDEEEADSNMIANPAQKILYEQLKKGFEGVRDSAPALKEEVDKVFAEAEAKYLNDTEESGK